MYGAATPYLLKIVFSVFKKDRLCYNFCKILNLEGNVNSMTGSSDTTILLNGCISLLVELQRLRVCDQRGYPVMFLTESQPDLDHYSV